MFESHRRFVLTLGQGRRLLVASLLLAGCGPFPPGNVIANAPSPANISQANMASANSLASAGPPVTPCANRPANGQQIGGYARRGREVHVLEISNGMSGDAIIKVRNARDNRVAVAFFVAAGETASIENVPDGDYRIQYSLGETLATNCRSFVDATSVSQFPEPWQPQVRIEERSDGRYRIRDQLSYTLHPVEGGTTVPQVLDPTAFDQE